MNEKNEVQVVIGGKVLTMSGAEDELHIQKVASCVNRMIRKMEGTEAYHALPTDMKPLLIELNIAEELIQSQEKADQLADDLQLLENELSEVKQKLVDAELRLERYEGKRKK